jgi:Transposase DDE domain
VGVEVTLQGVDERINAFSVAFLRKLFSQALAHFKNKGPFPLSVLQQFSAVNLVDSSTRSLPEHMAEENPGGGRRGAQAALKIQLVFDFLQGTLKQVALKSGIDSDQGYREYLQVVEGGSLTIVDLGYFGLDAFRAMANKSAYFLSRYFYPTGLLDEFGKPIDLARLLRKQTSACQEVQVKLGCRSQHQIPCRWIMLRHPKQVTEQRRRTAKKHAKKRGTTLSSPYLFLLGWTLFVTNAPESKMSLRQVYDFYRIRWQIELIFKLWKSYCGLNQILARRKERVLTELYAKMIGIVIVHFLLAPLRIPDEIWSEREVGNVRFQQILTRFARSFKPSLADLSPLAKTLDDFFCHVERFALKQKRRQQPNAYAQLAQLALPLP